MIEYSSLEAIKTEGIITIALALLGGGGIWSIFAAWVGFSESRKVRRKDYLEAQLKHLYGPLALLCHKAETFCGFSKNHQDACHRRYEQMENLSDEASQRIGQEMEEQIQYRNRYAEDITQMRQQAQQLIESNFQWLDSADVQASMKFILHVVRCKREHKEPNALPPSLAVRMPIELYKSLEVPSVWLPSFSKRIIERHKEKQCELEKLFQGWFCRLSDAIMNFISTHHHPAHTHKQKALAS